MRSGREEAGNIYERKDKLVRCAVASAREAIENAVGQIVYLTTSYEKSLDGGDAGRISRLKARVLTSNDSGERIEAASMTFALISAARFGEQSILSWMDDENEQFAVISEDVFRKYGGAKVSNGHLCCIEQIYVAPKFRNRGVGATLLRSAFALLLEGSGLDIIEAYIAPGFMLDCDDVLMKEKGYADAMMYVYNFFVNAGAESLLDNAMSTLVLRSTLSYQIAVIAREPA